MKNKEPINKKRSNCIDGFYLLINTIVRFFGINENGADLNRSKYSFIKHTPFAFFTDQANLFPASVQ